PGRDAPDLVASLGEPERPVGAGRDPAGVARRRVLGKAAPGRDAADPAGVEVAGLSEPERPVGAGGDRLRTGPAVGIDAGPRDRVLGKAAAGRYAPDLVGAELGEPERPVWAGGDIKWLACERRHCELAESAPGRDAPDLVGAELGEP